MPTTSRIACLRIPDFPIAAHRRAEGKAPDPPAPPDPPRPAIVVRGEGKRALVAAASGAARVREIEVGMRAADARAQLPGLREWEWYWSIAWWMGY